MNLNWCDNRIVNNLNSVPLSFIRTVKHRGAHGQGPNQAQSASSHAQIYFLGQFNNWTGLGFSDRKPKAQIIRPKIRNAYNLEIKLLETLYKS